MIHWHCVFWVIGGAVALPLVLVGVVSAIQAVEDYCRRHRNAEAILFLAMMALGGGFVGYLWCWSLKP